MVGLKRRYCLWNAGGTSAVTDLLHDMPNLVHDQFRFFKGDSMSAVLGDDDPGGRNFFRPLLVKPQLGRVDGLLIIPDFGFHFRRQEGRDFARAHA